MNEIEIELNGRGRGSVVVNGIDISDMVSDVEVMASTSEGQSVRLTVRADRLKVLASVAKIDVGVTDPGIEEFIDEWRRLRGVGVGTATALNDVIAQRLRYLRKMADLTHQDLADRTGGALSAVTIGNIEREPSGTRPRKVVTVGELFALAGALGVPPSDLTAQCR